MPDGMRKLFEQQQDAKRVVVLKSRSLGVSTMAAMAKTAHSFQRHATHRAGEMNKTEARYAQHLEVRQAAGEIAWFAFERMKLRLAPRTHLTVDFFVQLVDGSFECHEVKGRKGNRYFAEEDAKLKIKIAAEMFPVFRFLIVWPARGGGWSQERFG